jgi:hypothetical protein
LTVRWEIFILFRKNNLHSLESAKSLHQVSVFCVDCSHFKDFKCKLGYKTNPRNRVCSQAVKRIKPSYPTKINMEKNTKKNIPR